MFIGFSLFYVEINQTFFDTVPQINRTPNRIIFLPQIKSFLTPNKIWGTIDFIWGQMILFGVK